MVEQARAYIEAMPTLRRLYPQHFIALPTVTEKRDTGEIESFCAWTGWIPTVLSECQYVTVILPEGESAELALAGWLPQAQLVQQLRLTRTEKPVPHYVTPISLSQESQQAVLTSLRPMADLESGGTGEG